MAKPFKTEKVDLVTGNPNYVNPSQAPTATLITFTEPTSGGIPIGPSPGATDAPPGKPNNK